MRRATILVSLAMVVLALGTATATEPGEAASETETKDEEQNPFEERVEPLKEDESAKGVEQLPEVLVEEKRPLSAASSDEINASRFELRPHSRMIQILKNIPGLVVAQHQGGNKAPSI